MKKILPILAFLSYAITYSQENILPRWLTPEEVPLIEDYKNSFNASTRGITTPPTGSEIRTPGEWEEMQAIVITWTSFPSIHRQLVQHIQQECEVWIVTTDSNAVKNNITSNGGNLTNVKFINAPFNSIWVRDYGPNPVYLAGVDSLAIIDWIYNRPRYQDNAVPDAVGLQKNIPVYSMSIAPNDLVHTGGNFMADGFGTGFSSELVDEENDAGSPFTQSAKTPAQVDALMQQYMGINPYIKMTTLPYDDIHHIDMHMKLLDEETLLVGEFPQGVSDGPQIEMNLQYIQDNYTSVFGTPYKIVRIPMPPNPAGTSYPGQPFGNAYYRTYANNLIVNKTVIVPVYREEYDTTGLRIIQEAMPGYNVVGIDVDNTGSNLIAQGGAIHCITKEINVEDPLLISHQNLPDTPDDINPYGVNAYVRHRSGIASATLYYTTDLSQNYTAVPMTFTNGYNWTANIPAQPQGTVIYYYIHGQAHSGKQQVRPIVAPDGYFKFKILTSTDLIELNKISLENIFPNPSNGLTCIPIKNFNEFNGSLSVYDQMGRLVQTIHEGSFATGPRKYFIDVTNFPAGMYHVVLSSEKDRNIQKLIVR
ncbi:MAG: agmatine deiminase family protein [Flavobacteriales bacterium]